MPDHETDEEIISSYLYGDEAAFKKLVDRYTAPLYNFVARLGSRADAPDVLQEVFLKAWKNISSFDGGKASFKTWIFTIAKNTATDFLRKKKSLLFSDMKISEEEDMNSFAENIPAEELLPPQALQKLEDAQFLNNLLQNLRPEYREILSLHYQEEMTFEEIGEILHKPQNTVKSQHRRAILELRKMLE